MGKYYHRDIILSNVVSLKNPQEAYRKKQNCKELNDSSFCDGLCIFPRTSYP